MTVRQYHIVGQMLDEYGKNFGFELEYFNAGENLIFERFRRHNSATISFRFDDIVKQKKMVFAKESDASTALFMMLRGSDRKIPVVLFQIGWREGQDISEPSWQQDQSSPYYVAHAYRFTNATIVAMSPRVRDRIPDSDLDLITL